MERMSARFVANKMGMSTAGVYKTWEAMGIVMKDSWGDWTLTDLGREIGGKMSNGNRLQVPVFDFEQIRNLMQEFWKNN